MIDAGRIEMALRDAGAFVEGTGVSVSGDGTPALVFAPAATAQQRQAANAALAALDRRNRRRRPVAAILADLNALTAAQRTALLTRWLAQAASDDPRLLRRLGQAIDGDEPDV
jgi:hypothetical protein